LLKIPEILGKIYENVRKLPAITGKNGAQRVENHMKTFFWRLSQKMFVICAGENIRTKNSPKNFSGKFGVIRAKSVSHPKICLRLHLCLSEIEFC